MSVALGGAQQTLFRHIDRELLKTRTLGMGLGEQWTPVVSRMSVFQHLTEHLVRRHCSHRPRGG